MTAAVVLAAGEARRMGRPKLVLPLGERTILHAVLQPLFESSVGEIVVVLGHAADEVRQAASAPRASRLRFVVHDRWQEGMASSLRAGLMACPDAEAVLVVLGDEVGLTAALVERVLAVPASVPLVVPRLGSRASHPVRFSRALRPELLALEGDVGAREIVRRHLAEAVFVEGEPLHDVDQPADYDRLREGRPARTDAGLVLEMPEGV